MLGCPKNEEAFIVCDYEFELFPEESIIFASQPTTWRTIGSAILLLLSPLAFFIPAVFAVAYYLQWRHTVYVVTNRRVIRQSGVLSLNLTEQLSTKIESVTLEQTIIGRMLGFADVKITGTGGSPLIFQSVPDPLSFKQKVISTL